MRRVVLSVLVRVLVLSWFTGSAAGFIEAPHSLGRICRESTNIVVVEVARIDRQKNLIIYNKVKDLKGKHPQEQMKHNVGQRGSHPREWQNVMSWAKEGRRAVFFHNGNASVTGIDRYWYQCFKEGQWWAMTHAEPFLLRTYYGEADRLSAAVADILAQKEVVVPAMVEGDKEQFHLRTGKVRQIRASLKRVDFDAKRDVVADGAPPPEPAAKTAKGAKNARTVVAAKDANARTKEARAKTPEPRTAQKATARQDGPARPGLVVDKAARTVTIPCRIAPRKLPHLDQVYPVEVVATRPHPDGQKAHETIVTFQNVKPSQVHAALEQIGLKPGKPARGEGQRARGPRLKLSLDLSPSDAKSKPIAIEDVLVQTKSGKRPRDLKWHFTGSVMRQPDPEKQEKVYGADVTGTLVALFPVTDDVVIQSDLGIEDEPKMKLQTNEKVLPKAGARIELVIEPI